MSLQAGGCIFARLATLFAISGMMMTSKTAL